MLGPTARVRLQLYVVRALISLILVSEGILFARYSTHSAEAQTLNIVDVTVILLTQCGERLQLVKSALFGIGI